MPLPIGMYLQAITRDGEALAAAAEGRLRDRVSACPDWDVADLVYHVGEVHDFWATIASERLDDPQSVARPERPPDDELVEWYRRGLERLIDVLSGTDPATECWTWTSQHDVAWIQRRMAQETAVHRWDSEAAPQPIDAALAVDGVDEFLEFFLGGGTALDGTLHLHATDAEGEWLIRLTGGAVEVERGHAKGNAAVRGPASDLLLLLWRRRPLDGLEVFGDASLVEAFVGETTLD